MSFTNNRKKWVTAALSAAAAATAALFIVSPFTAGSASAACQGKVFSSGASQITCSDEITTCTYMVGPEGPWTRCVSEGGINN
jgi:hypothetical protein